MDARVSPSRQGGAEHEHMCIGTRRRTTSSPLPPSFDWRRNLK